MHTTCGDGGQSLYNTWIMPQPDWSVVRDSTVWGHCELAILNATHAFWTWHRNPDPEDVFADSAYVINRP